MLARRRTLRWSLVGLVGLGGCAATSQLSGAAVEGALETVEEPSNLDTMEAIATSPQLQRSVESLGAAMVRGAMTGLAHGGIEQRELSDAVEAAGAGLVRGAASELPTTSALVDDAIASAVDSAIDSATSARSRERARLLVADITSTAVRSATSSFAEGLEQDILPMVDDATGSGPLIARLLDAETRRAIGRVIYEISRQATLGFEQAREQIRAQNRGLLGRMTVIGWAVLASLLVLLLGSVALIVVLVIRNRRGREQLRESSLAREQLLAMLIASLARGEQVDGRLHTALLQFLGAAGDRPP